MTTERDIQNQIDFAMDKGIEKGIAQGIEQGRKEERVRFIEALKIEGVPEDVINKALTKLN